MRRRLLYRFTLSALFVSSLLGANHPAQAQMSIGSPLFEWTFQEIPSDGKGGTLNPRTVVGPRRQIGGALDQTYQIPPPTPIQTTLEHLKVFSTAPVQTFWSEAIRPVTNQIPTDAGIAVGGTSQLAISQSFRKDDPNAAISFTISHASLTALSPNPGPPHNDGLTGTLVFAMTAYDAAGNSNPNPPPVIDSFTNSSLVTGRGGAWDAENFGPLDMQITRGGLDQSLLVYSLQTPFTHQLDLSSVALGEEFTVVYNINTTAIDTVQADSLMQSSGRDPQDVGSGVFFNFSGLTPTNNPFVPGVSATVPEPSAYAVVSVAIGLLTLRRFRRNRG